MPAKSYPVHIHAVAPLHLLSEHARVLKQASLNRPIDDMGRSDLLRLAIESLKAVGCTSEQVNAAVHSAFPQTPETPAKMVESLTGVNLPAMVNAVKDPEPAKTGGLFSRK